MQEKNNETGLEIAVIGMAGRFFSAKNIHEYWNKRKTIELMKERFLTVMESILNNPKAKIRGLDYALPDEKEMSKVEVVEFEF